MPPPERLVNPDSGTGSNAHTKQYYIAIDDTDPTKWTLYNMSNGTKVRKLATASSGVAVTVSESSLSAAESYVKLHVLDCGINDYKDLVLVYPAKKYGGWASNVRNPDYLGGTSKADVESRPMTQAGSYEWLKDQNPNFFTATYWNNQTGQVITSSAQWPGIHAHHIVPKAESRGTTSVHAAHQILRTVGIDPYFGSENLLWAPNWQNHRHGETYRNQVLLDLRVANVTANSDPTEASISLLAAKKLEVVQILDEVIAQNFFYARYSM